MANEPVTFGYITGKTVTVSIRREADGFWYDFNNATFASSGWTTPKGAMTELTGAGVPAGVVGEYRTTVNPATWTDGVYQAVMNDSAVTTGPVGAADFRIKGGTITLDDNIKAKTDNLPSAVVKNTTLANFSFPMFDAADGRTPKTGLTVTGQRSLDGGAFANLTNAVTELANGLYVVNLAAADLNGNVIVLRFTASGADATLLTIITKPS